MIQPEFPKQRDSADPVPSVSDDLHLSTVELTAPNPAMGRLAT